MKHCLNCYRLIENNAEFCPFCGMEQDYSSKEKKAKYKKCPRCMAFLYNEEEGCQACGYRKKRHSGMFLKITAAFFITAIIAGMMLFLFLRH